MRSTLVQLPDSVLICLDKIHLAQGGLRSDIVLRAILTTVIELSTVEEDAREYYERRSRYGEIVDHEWDNPHSEQPCRARQKDILIEAGLDTELQRLTQIEISVPVSLLDRVDALCSTLGLYRNEFFRYSIIDMVVDEVLEIIKGEIEIVVPDDVSVLPQPPTQPPPTPEL